MKSNSQPEPSGKPLSLIQLIQLRSLYMKEFCANSVCALGNILLLLGGDDSIELTFKPASVKLLNSPPIPLAADTEERQAL